MKERLSIFTFLTIALSSLVSAGPVDGIRVLLWGLRDILGELITFFSNLLWDIDTFDEFLLAKILLLIIIYIVVYMVLGKSSMLGAVESNKTIYSIISAAIAILSIRFMPDEFMNFILIQYTTLGVAITTFLPLIIFFLFVHQTNIGPFGRRAAWFLYFLVFLVMWSYRGGDLGAANWVYIGAVIFILVSLIWDRQVHRYFAMSGYRRIQNMSRERLNRHWRRELFQLEEDYRRGIIDAAEYQRSRSLIDARIRAST